MSAAAQAPDPTATTSDRRDIVPLKLFGIEVPMPPWAASAVAAITIVALPICLLMTFSHRLDDKARMEDVNKATAALNSTREHLKEAEAKLDHLQTEIRRNEDYWQEYRRHFGEPGDTQRRDRAVNFQPDPRLTITFFPSDGCVWVVRPNAGGKWIPDPSRHPGNVPSPGRQHGQPTADLHDSKAPLYRYASWRPDVTTAFRVARAVAQFDDVQFRPVQQRRSCTEQCVGPKELHSGTFESRNGTTRECWLQVWRRFDDGCVHYQWFNTCSSLWETDQEGRPVVYWEWCCHHRR